MGNKQTLNPQIPQINLNEWEEIQMGQMEQTYYGDFRTLRHVQTDDRIDEYEMFFTDEEDFKVSLTLAIDPIDVVIIKDS